MNADCDPIGRFANSEPDAIIMYNTNVSLQHVVYVTTYLYQKQPN